MSMGKKVVDNRAIAIYIGIMAAKKLDNPRTQHQIFAEDSVWEMARHLSKRYTSMDKPICGKRNVSASWYFRNAVLERIRLDGAKLDALGLTDCKIYEPRR